MRKIFKMTQEEMDDIIAINKANPKMPVVLLFGKYNLNETLENNINSYWEGMGKKYGFDSLTVEPSDESKLHFTAEPTSIEEKTESQ